ncbi:Fe-S cluster protein [Marinilabiliaceae bacterium JC017]|nr:Fe-S cluster protein [Marinilabiliaceae bacterium JC017]
MNLKPIYTEVNDCKDCYKCIRECPTKAIKIADNKASIVDDLCIYCGHCVSICPAGAKKVRNGISRAKWLIKHKPRVFVSLAPSYASEFPNTTSEEMVSALKKLGFNGISETALGAQKVSEQLNSYLEGRQNGVYISSACPSVVELIRKYYPQHTMAITPFMSPMLAHAKMLKDWYGEDTSVVFIGPCIAKKLEADNFNQLIDAALTFKELSDWLEAENIDFTTQGENNEEANTFIPFEAADGAIYPLDGGMINTLNTNSPNTNSSFMSFSGMDQVNSVLKELDTLGKDRPMFLELLACEGGCINGPGINKREGIVKKKLSIIEDFNNRKSLDPKPHELPSINIERDYFNITPVETTTVTNEAIRQALYSIGKTSVADELNCSGCGYDTCRDFAKALLENRAESAMCVSYMRQVAHHKATILLQKIPSGVIIVDDQNKVVEMNHNFAHMLGQEMELCFEANPGMRGAELEKLGTFSKHLKAALLTGKEFKEITFVENGRNFQLSIFNIQKHKLVTGIMQNIHQPEFQKDIVEKRTREVISKNMETVQKIAFLLGENASYTDSLLNSILDAHKEPNA